MREINIKRESEDQSAPALSSLEDISNSEIKYTKIDDFLKDVSIRAFNICVVSCRNKDDAHDIVQNSMCKLVEKYKHNPAHQWKPLFYTILRNKLKLDGLPQKIAEAQSLCIGPDEIKRT